MDDKFSFKRVGLLLRYDWVTCKKNLMFSVLIIELLDIIFTVGTYYKNIFGIENPSLESISNFAEALISFNRTLCSALIAVVTVIWLQSLNKQLVQPASATRYMMIPAKVSERFVAIHFKYIIGLIGANIIAYLNLIVFKLIFIPSMLNRITVTGHDHSLRRILLPIVLVAITLSFVYLIFLNFLFIYRKHPQLKSILSTILFMLGYLVFSVGIFNMLRYYINGDDNINFFKFTISLYQDFDLFLFIYITYCFLLIPVILQYFASYYSLKEKQIR